MTETDVAMIEGALAVKLPNHYRRFLLSYPASLIENKLDLGWCREAPAERQLHNTASRLIYFNRDVRLPGTPWVGEAGDPWPDNYFVVGDDRSGNFWCIDLHQADSGVWFYDHDQGAFERQHGSLTEFGEWLLAYIKEFNQSRDGA